MNGDTNKKKTKTINKFCDGWLKLPQFQGWLQKSSEKKEKNELAFCKACSCNLVAHKGDLMKHYVSQKHKKNESKLVSTTDMADQRRSIDDTKRAEVKLSAFIAEHNLPFQVSECLMPLCKNIFYDSEIATNICCKRTKTTQIIKKVVGPSLLNTFYLKLKDPGKFFSIIMEETTEHSSIKQRALTAVFTNEENIASYNFFYMFEVTCGTAENFYSLLKDSIISKGITFENLVGFSSNTTNVMVGHHNSVFSHLKKDLPDIACVKCSCHMIHLAASKACKKLPKSVEDMLSYIGAHFGRSSVRQQSFKEFQQFFNVNVHKILSPANTR